jgi:hypothetical protein
MAGRAIATAIGRVDPGIHPKKESRLKKMDCRVKPGNDESVVGAKAIL